MKNIKTFKDACEALKIKDILPDLSVLPPAEEKALLAHYKLTVIARALNEGWVPDWNNSSEYKYYPWFDMRSGFGFSAAAYVYGNTTTTTGSRLCFKTRELAEYAGKQFNAIYKDYFIIRKTQKKK